VLSVNLAKKPPHYVWLNVYPDTRFFFIYRIWNPFFFQISIVSKGVFFCQNVLAPTSNWRESYFKYFSMKKIDFKTNFYSPVSNSRERKPKKFLHKKKYSQSKKISLLLNTEMSVLLDVWADKFVLGFTVLFFIQKFLWFFSGELLTREWIFTLFLYKNILDIESKHFYDTIDIVILSRTLRNYASSFSNLSQ